MPGTDHRNMYVLLPADIYLYLLLGPGHNGKKMKENYNRNQLIFCTHKMVSSSSLKQDLKRIVTERTDYRLE